jgi:hypothetical protein
LPIKESSAARITGAAEKQIPIKATTVAVVIFIDYFF